MSTYNRLPVSFERGEGAWLYDVNGEAYLDALSGIAVCVLGHAHPSVTTAIQAQAARLLHTSNLYGIASQERLGEKLCTISKMSRVFFANSGAEANEAAIKLARLYGHQNEVERPKIVVFDGAFHGRTLAALSATANPAAQQGFAPLVEGFIRIPFGDTQALKNLKDENIVAILAEPIQGEGGIRIPQPAYLRALRDTCDQHGWLLMLDEIQTGMGRTGRWFAHQHEDIVPDVMTLAKGLGNGFPIGACIAHGKAAELFTPGTHGSTFGGNPLACEVGLAVIDEIEASGLVSRAAQQGERLLGRLRQDLGELDGVLSIRGAGLMLGVELDRPCTELVGRALAQNLLINVTAGSVIRLLPPLIISDEQVEKIASILNTLVRDFLRPT